MRALTGSGGRLHFGMVAGIKSERWPTSNRNPWPDCVGIRSPFGAAIAGRLEDGEAAYGRGDYATALRLWQPLADEGNSDAQLNVGTLHDTGQGVPQDHRQADAWYLKAANQGNADAQFALGMDYSTGQGGVPQDDGEAAAWFRKAADQGNADAQWCLGEMYENGEGVPQDYARGFVWYSKAADQNDLYVKDRDALAAKMTPAQMEEAQRFSKKADPK